MRAATGEKPILAQPDPVQKQTGFLETGQRSPIQLDLLSGLATETCISLILDWVLYRRRLRDSDIMQSKWEMTASFTPFLQISSYSTVGEPGEPHRLHSPSPFLVQALHLPLLWGCAPEKNKKDQRRQGEDFRRHRRAYEYIIFFLNSTLSQLSLIGSWLLWYYDSASASSTKLPPKIHSTC